ncbi:MAG: FecR domain-containing protein [Rhodospirillales bacterium]|nr:FecR domain-containing protein [Rhodospirillales bacterium]
MRKMAFCRLIVLVFALLVTITAAHSAEIAGKVSRLQGAATATASGVSRDLKAGAAIMFGDRILTGESSRLEMRMHDGAVITLGDNAHFTIGEFESDDRGGVFGLFRGAFLAVSGKINESTSSPLTVLTPNAVAGVRGTTIWGEQDGETLSMALFEGKLLFVESRGLRVDLTEPLFGTTVKAGKRPTKPKRWGDAKIEKAKASVAFK